MSCCPCLTLRSPLTAGSLEENRNFLQMTTKIEPGVALTTVQGSQCNWLIHVVSAKVGLFNFLAHDAGNNKMKDFSLHCLMRMCVAFAIPNVCFTHKIKINRLMMMRINSAVFSPCHGLPVARIRGDDRRLSPHSPNFRQSIFHLLKRNWL